MDERFRELPPTPPPEDPRTAAERDLQPFGVQPWVGGLDRVDPRRLPDAMQRLAIVLIPLTLPFLAYIAVAHAVSFDRCERACVSGDIEAGVTNGGYVTGIVLVVASLLALVAWSDAGRATAAPVWARRAAFGGLVLFFCWTLLAVHAQNVLLP